MDFTTLAIFRVVALENSVTTASRTLMRAQSNVTTRIQNLEEELGVKLFLRAGKRMTLTDEGREFLSYAEKLLALQDEACQSLHKETPRGRLRIGTMESTAASRLPSPLSAFSAKYPDVTLEVSTGTSCFLIEAVLASRLDCALVAYPGALNDTERQLEPLDEGLEGVAIFREELILALPAHHAPVNGPEDVTVTTLAGFPHGCTYRQVAETWLRNKTTHRESALTVHEVGSYHSILACVAAGACIGILPRSVFELARTPPPIQVFPIMNVDTLLIWRAGYGTAAFESFRETLQAAN